MRVVVLGLVLAWCGGPAAQAAGEPALRVTTNTIEYCASLAARLAELRASLPAPARALAADGAWLCDHGHVRTGVAKLRRAIRLARPD